MIDLKDQRFGVELEFTGITRRHAATVLANHFGVDPSTMSHESSYDNHSIRTPDGRKWSIMSDASIPTDRTTRNNDTEFYSSRLSDYSCEFVTPICTYDDIENIQGIVRELRAAGAKVNNGCGMHVHVDGANHDVRSLVNLSKMMWAREDILYHALDIPTPRLQYCAKTSQDYIDRLNSVKPVTKQQLKECWYGDSASHTGHYDSSRYRALNLHAYFTKGTVEFRCYNATMHAGKVKAYIQFSLGCSARAINMGNTSLKKKTDSENWCYTFRTFLIKIPLNGKEFETCRFHMLANLEGDKAYLNKEECMRRRLERAQAIRDRLDELSDTVGEQLTPERVIEEPEREDVTRSITTRQQIIELLEEMQGDTSISNEERSAIRLVLGFREDGQAPRTEAVTIAQAPQTGSTVQQWISGSNVENVQPFNPTQQQNPQRRRNNNTRH